MQVTQLDPTTRQVLCDCGSTDFHVTFRLYLLRLHCKHCTNIITVQDAIHATKDKIDDLSRAMKKTAEQQRRYRPPSDPYGFDPGSGRSSDEDWG